MILYGRDGADFLRGFFPRKPMFVASNTIDTDELRRHRDRVTPAARAAGPSW